MAQVLKTIEEYIATIRKKDTIFISFNEPYARASLGMVNDVDVTDFMWFLDKDKTNWEKREEFIKWMRETYPNVHLEDVFDDVPMGYLEWPFLGTIAIDVDIDSPEDHAINSRYEDEKGKPYSLDAVVWSMTFEIAQGRHAKKEAMWEEEFGDE